MPRKVEIIELAELPDIEWFVLDVTKADQRKWVWCALMVDVDPDHLKTCTVDFPALLYVHPNEYQPGPRRVRQCYVRIPGKHRNHEAAWEALETIVATRH
jgi:hypothetical protein